MPYISTFVPPELFRVIRGVEVFQTYKDDETDQGTKRYRFTLHEDSHDKHFDVSELDVPSRQLLNAHPPFKTDDEPAWVNASDSERAKINEDWEQWHLTGEADAIAKIIDEALDAGLLELPPNDSSVDGTPIATEIKIQINEVYSNQVWASDPDMVEVTITSAFLQSAEKHIAYMQEHELDYCSQWEAVGYTLFKLSHQPGTEAFPTLIGRDGQDYEVFEPKYQLQGCAVKIFKNGNIHAVFPFKHTQEQLWFDVGDVKNLKFKQASTARHSAL